jgi:hypothetical protein
VNAGLAVLVHKQFGVRVTDIVPTMVRGGTPPQASRTLVVPARTLRQLAAVKVMSSTSRKSTELLESVMDICSVNSVLLIRVKTGDG